MSVVMILGQGIATWETSHVDESAERDNTDQIVPVLMDLERDNSDLIPQSQEWSDRDGFGRYYGLGFQRPGGPRSRPGGYRYRSMDHERDHSDLIPQSQESDRWEITP